MSVRDIIAEPLTLGRRSRRADVDARVEELLTLVGLPPVARQALPAPVQRRPAPAHLDRAGARAAARADRARRADVGPRRLGAGADPLLLKRLQDELGVTYLIISHDMVTVAYLASTVAVMAAGRVVEIGPTKQLFRSPEHAYTARASREHPQHHRQLA